jgi:ribonuclease R
MLEKIKGLPEEATLSRMTLRCMQQAQYTTDCEGHFGLALKYYCHFTSPIRRYPDLQIHRIIKEYLHGNQQNPGKSGSASKAGKQSENAPSLTDDRISHYNSILPYVAKHSSEMERRSDDAERQTDKQKKCEYMADRLGEEFEGVVSGVTGWGLYVELPNTCEGLIPMSCLFDDYYVFDEKSYILRGERKGGTYGLGQVVKVKVAAVDIISRTIDFTLLDENEKHGNDHDTKSDFSNKSRHAGNVHKGSKPGNRRSKSDSSGKSKTKTCHAPKSDSHTRNGSDASHLTKSSSHKSMSKSGNSESNSDKRSGKNNGSRKKRTGKTGIKQQKSIS